MFKQRQHSTRRVKISDKLSDRTTRTQRQPREPKTTELPRPRVLWQEEPSGRKLYLSECRPPRNSDSGTIRRQTPRHGLHHNSARGAEGLDEHLQGWRHRQHLLGLRPDKSRILRNRRRQQEPVANILPRQAGRWNPHSPEARRFPLKGEFVGEPFTRLGADRGVAWQRQLSIRRTIWAASCVICEQSPTASFATRG